MLWNEEKKVNWKLLWIAAIKGEVNGIPGVQSSRTWFSSAELQLHLCTVRVSTKSTNPQNPKDTKIQKIQKSIKSNGIPGVQSSRTWFSSNDLQPLWVAMPFVFLFVFWGEIRKMLTNKKWKKIHSLSCGRIKELAKKVQNYTKGLWYLRLFRSYF